MYLTHFPESSAKRSSSWLRKAFCLALLLALGTVAHAQISTSMFVLHPELLQPRVQPGTLAQDPPANSALHIEILEGDRGANIIKKKTAVAPVVEVRDRNRLPVAGALVTFSSPSEGPSVVFSNGSRSITVVADANGRATTVGLKPISKGKFQVSVSAAAGAETAVATISMTNYLTEAAAAAAGETAAAADAAAGATTAASGGGGGLSGGMIALIAGIAAAAAIGAVVGLTHHGSTSPSTTSTTIGVGSGGTVGAPH